MQWLDGGGISPLCVGADQVGEPVGGEIFWRPLKTPGLACPPATPGRRHGWADVLFTDGWQLVAFRWFHDGTSSGHLAPSHADRGGAQAGWEDTVGAPVIPAADCRRPDGRRG